MTSPSSCPALRLGAPSAPSLPKISRGKVKKAAAHLAKAATSAATKHEDEIAAPDAIVASDEAIYSDEFAADAPNTQTLDEQTAELGEQTAESVDALGDDEVEVVSIGEVAKSRSRSSFSAASEESRAAFLETLQRAKEGDKKAFEEIFQLYHRRIYNAAYGMLSDADDAQDVTQEVFLRLHSALPTLRADEAFSTYLYRIALNLCRDRARRKKRVRFQSIDSTRENESGENETMDFPDTGKLPDEILSNDELQTRVRQAVSTLSTDHKAVIVMHHFQGMEVNDIANILKVPTGTVKSRLARGRDQLHRKLRGYLNV